MTPKAIVFAYHDVGVRCLQVLLDSGVEIPLVVTHRDAPGETIWFRSVASLAAEHGLHCVSPDDPHTDTLLDEARACRPDFLFSFYYRRMLGQTWLDVPARGAFNMHGSLLPEFRGRAPVNWAILHGARQTGATLHRMNAKPDNGAIVDQCAVPILGDDTAIEVFAKVSVAAEIVLARALPSLVDGTAPEVPQDLQRGGYFGGRRPEDGRIPSDAPAAQIHDWVRALAPPFPGAFLELGGARLVVERTLRSDAALHAPGTGLRLVADHGALWLLAADGRLLRVLSAHWADGRIRLDSHSFASRFPARWVAADR
ncbi:formyltransferase [Variovorax sp. RT4R15]|uniref:formyltransferase n=1 Tax=Variovorax sp. RT4R15 TaxID=3443737 RepID=UPI003F4626D0